MTRRRTDRWLAVNAIAATALCATFVTRCTVADDEPEPPRDVVSFPLPDVEATRDVRFLEGLRARRLYDLAERQALSRYEAADPESRARIDLAVERIRTAAERAAVLPPAERPPAWKAARELASKLSASEAKHPHAMLLRLQDGLTLVLQGDQLRREVEVGAGDETTLATARSALEEATRVLEKVRSDCEAQALERRRSGDEKSSKNRSESGKAFPFTLEQWQALARDATKHLANARRSLAECYPPRSDDRTALLVSASESLKKSLSGAPLDEAWAAEMRVLLMACSRVAGDAEQITAMYELVDRDEVPAKIRGRGIAEMVTALVDSGQLDKARKLVDRPETRQLLPWPAELSDAALQLVLAEASAAVAAGETDRAGELQKQALALVKQMEQEYGVYWGRRAEQQMVRSDLRGAGGDAGAELTAKLADNLVVKGSYVDAVRAYDEAADGATQSAQRFANRFKAALVYSEKLKRHDIAAERLRQLATQDPKNPKAAEAHLLGAWNAAQMVGSDPTLADVYVAFLQEHINFWPGDETSNQARLWLGKWWLAQGAWKKSLDVLTKVEPSSPQMTEALAAIATCTQNFFRRQTTGAEESKAVSDQLVSFYQQIGDSPSATDDTRRAALLGRAEFILAVAPEHIEQIESALREQLANSKKAPAAWRNEAQSLLVAVLASQSSKRSEALALLREMSETSPSRLAALLGQLASIARRESASLQKELAPLQLEAATLALKRKDQLTPDEGVLVAKAEAAALAATGKQDQAIAKYAALTKQKPDDGVLQEDFAQLLLDSGDPAQRRLALDRWRIIAQKSPPRTPRWFRAKHRVASAQFLLGDKVSAATLLRSILETPPGVADPSLRKEYLDLLSRCEK